MVFEETSGIQRGTGIKTVIYGQEGVGKSSLAAQFPGAVFIDCEGSTSKMDVRRLPKPTSWEMLKQEMDFILQSHKEKGYKTVNIDTFDWAERLAILRDSATATAGNMRRNPSGGSWILRNV